MLIIKNLLYRYTLVYSNMLWDMLGSNIFRFRLAGWCWLVVCR